MHPEELTSTQPALPSKTLFLSKGRTLANRYEVRDVLGYGGMSEVWLGYDVKLRMEVALKAMLPEKFPGEKGREILRREVRNAREVISPNVCRVFDLFEWDAGELVSMEYVRGITLQQLLFDRGPLGLKEAQEIASQFLAGLEEIHRAGLVHRDVKPSNIMVTGTGRVVVMDFGVASGMQETPMKISGTPPYMAPEFSESGRIDARTDVFSAGMVLAEMVSSDGIRDELARRALWEGMRSDPPRVPETPWTAVLRKAVARDPEARYRSAGELLRALEQVTLRAVGTEHLNPYPGLAAFTEVEAAYFFGREAEVEQILRKLDQPRLHALVGPSGTGKTSFLRAGVMALSPPGWHVALITPGTEPLATLARVLSSKHEAADHVLLIIDQFEELFTLNPPEVREAFALALSRLPLASDVAVLLSMRDDFLFHCQRFEALRPIFADLTALGPPTGAALRRALVQPALRCGYQFQDELLVDEIVGEVEEERGALPLMAFAVAQLWQKRDRDQGWMTREAYQEIGGVAGALAQHAEATMERIGTGRIAIVRELVRNLVTQEGTRSATDRGDLLSIFPRQDREIAAGVLDALIAARLLTSFEVREFHGSAEEPERRRVEIVHESLLNKWPRLVRWQTQDAEGVQLRDDLRRAAHLWDQHDRSADFLWTGTAYQEYQLWRKRYSGGLTPLEEAFGEAAAGVAGRKRIRARIAAGAILVLALVIAVVTSALWRRAEKDARRAEAAEILALGRLKLEDNPTAALAYALASLQRADSPAARRFGFEALWRGGAAIVVPIELQSVDFSPEGAWLATGGATGGVQLWSRDGGVPKVVQQSDGRLQEVRFGAGNRLMIKSGDRTVRVLSIPDVRELRKLDFKTHVWVVPRGARFFTAAEDPAERQPVHSWPLGPGQGQFLGRWDPTGDTNADISGSGEWLSEARGRALYVRPLNDLSAPRRMVGEHRSNVSGLQFNTADDRLLSVDETGELRIWPIQAGAAARSIQLEPGTNRLMTNADGSTLVAVRHGVMSTSQIASVWEPTGPPDVEPRVLRYGDARFLHSLSLEPSGRWLAAALNDFAILWPVRQPFPRVIHGEVAPSIQVAFTTDGKWLASASQATGGVRLWPLLPGLGPKQALGMPGRDGIAGLAVDPVGRNLLSSVFVAGQAVLIPLDGGSVRILPGNSRGLLERPAFSADGRLAAAASRGPNNNQIHVWNLETGSVIDLNPRVGSESPGRGQGFDGAAWQVEFTSDGNLLSAGTSGLRLWDLARGTSILLKPSTGAIKSVLAGSSADRFLLAELDITRRTSTVTFYDLRKKMARRLTTHGNRVQAVALDPTGTIAVTGDFDGVMRVGPVSGQEPHLLLGHRQEIASVAVSQDRKWIASGSEDGTIRLWPMPEVFKPPFHTLAYPDIVKKLQSATNLRVIADPSSANGYRVVIGPFPGWKTEPDW